MIYKETSFSGHFGKKTEGKNFTWERLDQVEELKKETSD